MVREAIIDTLCIGKILDASRYALESSLQPSASGDCGIGAAWSVSLQRWVTSATIFVRNTSSSGGCHKMILNIGYPEKLAFQQLILDILLRHELGRSLP